MQTSKTLPPSAANPSVRTLKIEAVGDFWKGLIKPKIRLVGNWLERAGFQPGTHVHVTCVAPGVIELRSPEKSSADQAKPTSSEQIGRSL